MILKYVSQLHNQNHTIIVNRILNTTMSSLTSPRKSLEYDASGYDPITLLYEDNLLPIYSTSTRTDDKKVRAQYISFLQMNQKLPLDYFDDTYSSYFAESGNTSNNTPSELTLTPATISVLNSSPHAIATIPTNSSTTAIDRGHATQTIRQIKETVTTVTVDSQGQLRVSTTDHERHDLLHALGNQSSSTMVHYLFQLPHIYAFMNAKIQASIVYYNEAGEHNLSIKSIRERYLPSLQRMLKHEYHHRQGLFDNQLWSKVNEEILRIATTAELPIHQRVFFPITRPILAYFIEIFPHGKSWFPCLMLFLSLYQCGLRSGSLLRQTWDCIYCYRTFMYKNDPDEMEEVGLEIDHLKKRNKKHHVPIYLIGYKNLTSDHPKYLLSSPSPLFWLQLLLKEQHGMSFTSLLEERNKEPGGSEMYRQLAHTYIFANAQDKVGSAINQSEDDVTRRIDSMSIMMNKHLKEVAMFCGFSDEIIGSIALHSSLRQGAALESEAVIQRGDATEDVRNLQMGWQMQSNVARTIYDASQASMHWHYANSRYNVIPSGLPPNRNIDVFLSTNENNTLLTLERLIEVIKCTHNFIFSKNNTKWIMKPFPKNVLFEHNYELCLDVYATIPESGSTREQQLVTMKTAIVLASAELKGEMIQRLNISQDYPSSREFYLCQVSGMRRDEMGRFFMATLRPYADKNKITKEKLTLLKSRLAMKLMNNDTSHTMTTTSPFNASLSTFSSSPLKKPTMNDKDIMAAIKRVNTASIVDMMKWIDEIVANQIFKSISSTNTRAKSFGKYDILSHILFKTLCYSSLLHNHVTQKGYSKKFLDHEDRMSRNEKKQYEKAIRNRVTGSGISTAAKQEIMFVMEKYPKIQLIYGWQRLMIAMYPKLQKEGLTPQQLKDCVRNVQSKIEKDRQKAAIKVMSQTASQFPLPNSIPTTNISKKRGAAYLIDEENSYANDDTVVTLQDLDDSVLMEHSINNPPVDKANTHMPYRVNALKGAAYVNDVEMSFPKKDTIIKLPAVDESALLYHPKNNPPVGNKKTDISHPESSVSREVSKLYPVDVQMGSTATPSRPSTTMVVNEKGPSLAENETAYVNDVEISFPNIDTIFNKFFPTDVYMGSTATSSQPSTTMVVNDKGSSIAENDTVFRLADDVDKSDSLNYPIINPPIDNSKTDNSFPAGLLSREVSTLYDMDVHMGSSETSSQISPTKVVDNTSVEPVSDIAIVGKNTTNQPTTMLIPMPSLIPRMVTKVVHTPTHNFAIGLMKKQPQTYTYVPPNIQYIITQSQNDNTPTYTCGFTFPAYSTRCSKLSSYPPSTVLMGNGYKIIHDDAQFTLNGQYMPTWIRPFINISNNIKYPKNGYCVLCGFEFSNSNKDICYPAIDFTTAGISGEKRIHYTCHDSCFKSHLGHYNTMRFNAIKCLYDSSNSLRWGLLMNPSNRWLYSEIIDLFVSIKLSGQLHVDVSSGKVKSNTMIDWNRVLRYGTIVQFMGRTNLDLAHKFSDYKGKMNCFFHEDFFKTNLNYDKSLAPPSIVLKTCGFKYT